VWAQALPDEEKTTLELNSHYWEDTADAENQAYDDSKSIADNLKAQSQAKGDVTIATQTKSVTHADGSTTVTTTNLTANNAEKMATQSTSTQDGECASIAQYRARYSSGCWTCLVMEPLISAFLTAAKNGLGVTQRAGIAVLLIGTMLWLAFWGLKQVSSFTEIQLGNILNDLIKFGFKVMLAYYCIVQGPTLISKYFVSPLMSVGAIIAQNFWPASIAEYTEEYEDITEEDQAAVEQFLTTGSAKGITVDNSGGAASTSTTTTTTVTTPAPAELTEEEKKENEQANKINEANFKSTTSAIPNLLIPGFKGGCVSSNAGCRPSTSGGSTCHHGIDVGCVKNNEKKNNENKKPCYPYVAAGPGTITYADQRGYGHTASIDHGKVGKYTWQTTYNHMDGDLTNALKAANGLKTGVKVKQGQEIGCAGGSGTEKGTGRVIENRYGLHIHFEVHVNGKAVDPLALLGNKIVFIEEICGANQKNCTGKNRLTSDAASTFLNCKSADNDWTCRKSIPATGWAAAGEAIHTLNSAVSASDITSSSSSSSGGSYNADSLIVEIKDVSYSGPTDIIPKSVMNSLLGAMRAITNQTADIMVLGNAVQCYAAMPNGGAWNISGFGLNFGWFPNIFMWVEGVILWFLGFMLTASIAYYLIDISFKIGFAVLSIPLLMGLWPFGLTQSKLYIAVSIIAKASATFAFLALTTLFGLTLLNSILSGDGLNGESGIFQMLDQAFSNGESNDDVLREEISNTFDLFSITFLMLIFGIIYTYKLVSATISNYVNRFFPDQMFGDSSPMHNAATMMTSWTKKMAGAVSGVSLARDIVAHQTGNLIKGGLQKGGRAVKDRFKKKKGDK
jgi:murein DD-endopeptidase MepM/ murein hydrolase activator NlpD